jgi:hypothetical protein
VELNVPGLAQSQRALEQWQSSIRFALAEMDPG